MLDCEMWGLIKHCKEHMFPSGNKVDVYIASMIQQIDQCIKLIKNQINRKHKFLWFLFVLSFIKKLPKYIYTKP